MIRRLLAEERGQSLVEYGLIAAALLACLVVAGNGIMAAQKGAYESQHRALQNWRAP
jgi:Flp pilus assembly pilin Flp